MTVVTVLINDSRNRPIVGHSEPHGVCYRERDVVCSDVLIRRDLIVEVWRKQVLVGEEL